MSLLIGAYVRVSTEEQAAVIEGSLDNQRHRMQSFIDIKNLQDKGWGKLVEVYNDDGYSAKDTNRPAYQRMIRDLKKGKINMILVTELSRLSRNIPDFCDLLEDLEDYKGKFLSIKEQFDTSTPAGEMMIYNMINLAQFERKQISERVAINCHSRALRGLNSGGPVPFGYNKHSDNKATLTVNENEAKQVGRVFDLFLENGSLGKTIPVLEALKIKPKVRSYKRSRLAVAGRWSSDSLSYLLQNPTYIGLKEINRAQKGKDQSHLKAWQKYAIVKASWPAIIDETTFQNVQQLLKTNQSMERIRLQNGTRRVFYASGLLRCGECDRALVGQSAHGKNQIHRYYTHASKKGDVIDCTIKRIRAGEIEDALENYLSEILKRAGHFDRVAQNIKKLFAASPNEIKAERSRLQREFDEVQADIQRTFRMQSTLDSESEAIKLTADQLEFLGQKKKTLVTELENFKALERQSDDYQECVIDLKERIETFSRGWAKASPAMKKQLLRNLLVAVVVVPDGIRITYRLAHAASLTGGESTNQKPVGDFKNVIEIRSDSQRVDGLPEASSSDGSFENGAVQFLQVVGIGRAS